MSWVTGLYGMSKCIKATTSERRTVPSQAKGRFEGSRSVEDLSCSSGDQLCKPESGKSVARGNAKQKLARPLDVA
jgi:hypothetical protein